MIYQFIPVALERVIERLIRSMATGTMALLDLEDGYLDVRDSGKTIGRRPWGQYSNILKNVRMSGGVVLGAD